MASEWVATIQDHGREKSTVGFRGINITPANFEAQMGLMDALYAAVQDVIIGTVSKTTRIAASAVITETPPENPYAQRESKWLVKARDDSNQRSVLFEIACADLSLLDPVTERMDPEGAEYLALKAAIEAYARSIDGNPVTVEEVVFVSRNT